MKAIKQAVCALFLAGAAASSLASPIVLDHSPVALGTSVSQNYYTNLYGSQYFAQAFSLSSATLLDGVDLYSGTGFGAVGNKAKVIIWGDNAKAPGTVLAEFSVSLAAIDGDGAIGSNKRKHVDFSGFSAEADTLYWISVAGDGNDLVQSAMQYVGDTPMRLFGSFGGTYTMTGTQLPFRLYGEPAASSNVPEPASLALFGLGMAGLGFLRRKRQA